MLPAQRLIAGVSYTVTQSMVHSPPPSSLPKKIILGIVGLVVGLPAFAVIAPLMYILMQNKTRSQKIIALFLPQFMKSMDTAFRKVKFELLKDIKPTDRVLDVGCGGGGWLPYFEKLDPALLTELEPNPNLIPVISREVAKFKQINRHCNVEVVNKFVHELAATREEKYDYVIFGNVMCEVPDQVQFLRDIDLVLKPGGKVVFLEHVRFEEGTWLARLQDWMNPLWERCTDGCNCNRNTLRVLRNHPGYQVVEAWDLINAGGPPFVQRMVAGICVKKNDDISLTKL